MTTQARLRAFVAVAESGSVRAAAERLVVTESAISAAVAALARELGVPLVERQGRGLRLTPAGTSYAGYARTILGLYGEALAAARGDQDPEHGRLRVAAVTTAGEHVLPRLLASFRSRHPNVDLRLEVGTSEQVWRMLTQHEVDLVIAGRPPPALDAEVRAVRPNTLVVVGSPTHPRHFAPGHSTWLMRERGSGTRATCEALLAALDVEPPQLRLGSNGAVVAGAVAGLGVALVSRDAVRRALAAGELVELAVPGTPLQRPWHAVTQRQASATVRLLVGYLLADADRPEDTWRPPPTHRRSPVRSTRRGR